MHVKRFIFFVENWHDCASVFLVGVEKDNQKLHVTTHTVILYCSDECQCVHVSAELWNKQWLLVISALHLALIRKCLWSFAEEAAVPTMEKTLARRGGQTPQCWHSLSFGSISLDTNPILCCPTVCFPFDVLREPAELNCGEPASKPFNYPSKEGGTYRNEKSAEEILSSIILVYCFKVWGRK